MGSEGDGMEDDRSTVARLRATFLRALRACADLRGRRREGPPERVIKDAPFSYGGWPGQEADYPVIQRLLWEMGKERKQRDEKKSRYDKNSLDTFS